MEDDADQPNQTNSESKHEEFDRKERHSNSTPSTQSPRSSPSKINGATQYNTSHIKAIHSSSFDERHPVGDIVSNEAGRFWYVEKRLHKDALIMHSI